VSSPRAQSQPAEPLHVPSCTGPDVGACQRQPAASTTDRIRDSEHICNLRCQLYDMLCAATKKIRDNTTTNAPRKYNEDNNVATLVLTRLAVCSLSV
jgi:hypothetical protein